MWWTFCPPPTSASFLTYSELSKNFSVPKKIRLQTAFQIPLNKETTMENGVVAYEPSCIYCSSPNLVKRGYRKNKNGGIQRFACKDCHRRFVLRENGFRKMEHKPEIVTLTLDLYFKGLSLRDISDHLKQFYDLEVSHVCVYKWIRKYVALMKNYIDELIPSVSGKWQADEMVVNVNSNYRWLWNLMDQETRFMLAMRLTEHREIEDAKALFREAKNRARKRPETITTDGLPSYINAYYKEFRTLKKPRTEHVRHIRFEDQKNINLIERFHGTVRERDKVMRALDSDKSAPKFVDGFSIYYNFLKLHMSLEGRTPAEAAGLDLKLGQNRWLSLVRRSIESRELTPKNSNTKVPKS
jgi:transposase-like protein